jgi:hypothetical protein
MHVRSCGATPEPRAVQRRARTGNPLPFVALPLLRHRSSIDMFKNCLGRPNSGAVVRDGKYVFICCGTPFSSTQALGIHKTLSHSGCFAGWLAG